MSETAAPRTRSVVAKGARVPWPRRLIAAGLLSAVVALALHALPRPYQTIPTGVVRGLGDSYGSLRSSYNTEVAELEPIAGEASDEERTAYARELWRYRWFGSFREILLRFAEWFAGTCMFVALSLILVERRRLRRELAGRDATTLLRHETLAGVPLATPDPPPPPTAPSARGLEPSPRADLTAPGAIPLRETGDEVTPPHPTAIPSTVSGALELRPASAPFDDDDLGRATENQAPNLAKRPLPANVQAAVPAGPAGLPVFFAELRHPDSHPVVHPGDAVPASPGDAPAPTPATEPPLAPRAPVTPTPTPVLASAVPESAPPSVIIPDPPPTPPTDPKIEKPE